MGTRRKRQTRSSGSSDSDDSLCVRKSAKFGITGGRFEVLSVSDVLSQTNSVLYEDESDSDDLIFKTSSSSGCTPENQKGSEGAVFSATESKQGTVEPSKMASSNNNKDDVGSKPVAADGDKLDVILSAIGDIKKNQEQMKRMFESKLDRLRTDLMENIDVKVKTLRDEFSLEPSREGNRISEVMTSIESMQIRIDSLERQGETVTGSARGHVGSERRHRDGSGLNDPEVTITASGIPVTDNEDLVQKAEQMIQALGDAVSSNVLVTGAQRLPTRYNNRPGLVKISFQNVDEKILVLRNKIKLKDTRDYRNVYLKSSKSHVERLIEINARAILNELPEGCNLRVDASGRIKKRVRQQEQQY